MASKNTHLRGCVAACALILCLAALWPAGARAQGGGPLYFPATGHHLDDEHGFLAFWRDHDGERRLGFPISEALPLDGATAQYFERGRLEQQAAADGTSRVVTGRVGSEYAEALWKRFAPAPPHKPIAGEQLFESTGHTTRGVFLSFWKGAGGLDFFGAPISEISWTVSALGGDPNPTAIPAGTFAAGTQLLTTVAQGTMRENCHTFRFANTALRPEGTYTAQVTYTLSAP